MKTNTQVNQNAGPQEDKKILFGGSQKRAREEDGEEEERPVKRFRYDCDCLYSDNTQNQSTTGAEADVELKKSDADVGDHPLPRGPRTGAAMTTTIMRGTVKKV